MNLILNRIVRVWIYLIPVIPAIICFSCTGQQDPVKVLSYNIRFASIDGSETDWNRRKDGIVSMLGDYDFIGLQEVMPLQQDFIMEHYQDVYGEIYRTREADPLSGEGVPLLYDKSKWDLVHSGTFWLSDTPWIEGSNTWNSACIRVTSYGIFARKNHSDTLLVMNTHFDHVSQEARMKSIRLIAETIKKYPLYPLILMGDFNVTDDNPVYSFVTDSIGLRDAWTGSGQTTGPESNTFHGWKNTEGTGRIDYIFSGPGLNPMKSFVNKKKYGNIFPSDHFPVEAIFSR